MKKTILSILLVCLLLTALPTEAFATEAETTAPTEAAVLREPGMCGEDLRWSYDAGTLTISGTGAMDDYSDGDAPWLEHKDNITAVVFTGGVTGVGMGAFTDYDRIASVDFGSAMHTVGEKAFKNCDGLVSIVLPASFRRFGKECFMSCSNLKEIWCQGGMPSFNGNCVWDTYATIYYPTNNAWPIEAVLQVQSAFQNRIVIQAGNYTASQPAAETTPTAPAETQPVQTVPAETQAVETVPAETKVPTVSMTETEAVTEATEITEETAAPTGAPTEPAPEETVPETQPQPERKHLGSMNGVVVCMVLFAAVLSLMLIGALIFRRRG